MNISGSKPLIKLLIICPIDPAGRKIGGVETAIRTYIKYAPSDFEIEIVGITLKGEPLKIGRWHEIIFAGRKVKFFPILRVKDPNTRNLLPLIFRFTAKLALWRHRIDFRERLIVFHRIEPAYLLKTIKENKILFMHGDIPVYFRNKFCENKWQYFQKLYFRIEPFFITGMKTVFVVSQSGCEYYRHKYSQHPVRFLFLPTWYDPQIFFHRTEEERERISSHYGFPSKSPVFLFVGRLEKQKNPLLLIESFLHIHRSEPEARLLIVGEGEMKSEILLRVKQEKLENNVSIFEKMTPREIAELMNISTIMLLTSAWEGMPRVVLESLACGLPVVATRVGETALVVRDGVSGRLISSDEPEAIAQAARELLTSPSPPHQCREAVSDYSREKVLSFFYDELRKAGETSQE